MRREVDRTQIDQSRSCASRRWPAIGLRMILLSAVLGPVAARAAPFAYVANYGEGTVSVVDTANNALVATVPVPYADHVAVSPDGTRLYVGGVDLSIIDTTTNTVAGKVTTTGSHGPMAFSPGGDRLYILGVGPEGPSGPGQLTVLDTAANTVLADIPVGLRPGGLAVAAGGLRVYVANTFDDRESFHCTYPPPLNGACILTLSVIDTTTNANIGIVQIGPGIKKVAATLTGGRVYVSGGVEVVVVDTGFNRAIAGIPGATDAIAVDPSATRVYATTPHGVELIDAFSNTVEASIETGVPPLPPLPTDLAVTPDGRRLYVTDGFANAISVVGTLADTEVITLPGSDIVIGPQNPPITLPPTPTATATPVSTQTSTPTPAGCPGDCNRDGSVTVDDILRMVNVALGNALLSDCAAGDADHDGQITVDEILAAVNNALSGCGVFPTPTPTA
jgi:YVTN family beta-propeller protein